MIRHRGVVVLDTVLADIQPASDQGGWPKGPITLVNFDGDARQSSAISHLMSLWADATMTPRKLLNVETNIFWPIELKDELNTTLLGILSPLGRLICWKAERELIHHNVIWRSWPKQSECSIESVLMVAGIPLRVESVRYEATPLQLAAEAMTECQNPLALIFLPGWLPSFEATLLSSDSDARALSASFMSGLLSNASLLPTGELDRITSSTRHWNRDRRSQITEWGDLLLACVKNAVASLKKDAASPKAGRLLAALMEPLLPHLDVGKVSEIFQCLSCHWVTVLLGELTDPEVLATCWSLLLVHIDTCFSCREGNSACASQLRSKLRDVLNYLRHPEASRDLERSLRILNCLTEEGRLKLVVVEILKVDDLSVMEETLSTLCDVMIELKSLSNLAPGVDRLRVFMGDAADSIGTAVAEVLVTTAQHISREQKQLRFVMLRKALYLCQILEMRGSEWLPETLRLALELNPSWITHDLCRPISDSALTRLLEGYPSAEVLGLADGMELSKNGRQAHVGMLLKCGMGHQALQILTNDDMVAATLVTVVGGFVDHLETLISRLNMEKSSKRHSALSTLLQIAQNDESSVDPYHLRYIDLALMAGDLADGSDNREISGQKRFLRVSSRIAVFVKRVGIKGNDHPFPLPADLALIEFFLTRLTSLQAPAQQICQSLAMVEELTRVKELWEQLPSEENSPMIGTILDLDQTGTNCGVCGLAVDELNISGIVRVRENGALEHSWHDQ